MIKYLIIASGGQDFFKEFAAIYTLIKNEFIKLENIEKIYGTSAGALISVLLSLNLDIEIIYTYILERPWEKLFNIDTERLFRAYGNNGIFDFDILNKCFSPILKLTTLPEDFTFNDIYEYSGKKIYCFATNYKTINLQEFSYDKTPNFSVKKSIYMSSSIPIVFKPLKYEGTYYIDGAFSARFPMHEFLKDNSGCNLDEILGIDIHQSFSEKNDDNIFIFNIGLLNNFIKRNSNKEYYGKIKHILQISSNNFLLNELYDILRNKSKRLEYFNSGKKDAEIFIKYFK